MTLITHDTENEIPYNVEFTLTVVVRGKKLQDIDDGLMQAAGDRLKARLERPLAMPNIKMPPAQASAPPTAAVTTPPAPTGKKRGRPAGWKKPVESPVAATPSTSLPPVPAEHDEPAEYQQEAVEEHLDEVAAMAAAAPTAAATLDDAVQALKLVNSTFNVDKARECLAHFKAARASELPAEQRSAFVAYCRKLCGV